MPSCRSTFCAVRLRLATLLMSLGFATPGLALAQATPGTLSGTVRDSGGRPLADAVVTLDPNQGFRSTRTDAQGRFRFGDLRPGDYELRTVWVGYRPDDRTVVVPREGLDVTIVLDRLPFQLDTMRIVAQRTGIIGTTVQQSDFRALGGVDVEILGTRHRLRTKADGLFNFEVREGSYVVLGRRSGFASRMVPVPVPSEEAVEVALALDTAETKAEQIVNNRIQDLQMRIRRASSMGTAIVGRHELLGVARRQDLETALRYAPSALMEGLIWERVECVFVDGLPQPGMLARDYLAEDVAMVEVYNRDGGSNARDMQMFRRTGTECGVGRVEESFETGRGAFRTYGLAKPGTVRFVWIWLKK